MSHNPEQSRDRIRGTLEQAIAEVDSPELADEVVSEAEVLASTQTEQAAGRHEAKQPGSAARHVEQAAQQAATKPLEVAAVLTTAAAETVAPKASAATAVEAAQEALSPTEIPASPRVRRGRSLLKEAVLRHMGPLHALDARLYMAVNDARRPAWIDAGSYALAVITVGGWVWVIGVLLAFFFRVPFSFRALKRLLPSVVVATWAVEYPIKRYFRRRRPFVEIVRALVVGKKPGSWSFPSGHTASSFACARVLSTVWPTRAPYFYALASIVGVSRVFVGAHYPGDVVSGAAFGAAIGDAVRRVAQRTLG